MKFRYFFIIIILITIPVSYFYSRDIYRFYIKSLFLDIKNENPETMTKKALNLYKGKKFEELIEYAKKVLIIYPGLKNIQRILGLALIEKGNGENGAHLVLDSMDMENYNRKHLSTAINVLFKKGLYTGIVQELSRFDINNDAEMTFINGVSLYNIMKYDDAIRNLTISEKLGNTSIDVYYYLGQIYEKQEKYSLSIENLMQAGRMSPLNRKIKKALVRLYRKTRQFAKAEKLTRSLR